MSAPRPATYVIKAAIADPVAATFRFTDVKTMYGGKLIAPGDPIFLIASETEGGPGLIGRGIVSAVAPTPRKPGLARQTPRISLTIRRTASATRPFGRAALKFFRGATEERPEVELDFKLYRQATNKVVGISEAAAAFLSRVL